MPEHQGNGAAMTLPYGTGKWLLEPGDPGHCHLVTVPPSLMDIEDVDKVGPEGWTVSLTVPADFCEDDYCLAMLVQIPPRSRRSGLLECESMCGGCYNGTPTKYCRIYQEAQVMK